MNGKPLNHNDFSYRQNRGPNGVIEPKAEALSLIQLIRASLRGCH